MKTSGCIAGVIWALLCCPAVAALEIETGTPAGFEELTQPRATLVTLSYGGRTLGHFAAHFTHETLQLDDPAPVIKAIGTLTHSEAVLDILKNPVPTHAELVCRKEKTPDCGILVPRVAGVIFDEHALSAELFMNPDYLPVSDTNGPRYLPLPERHASSVYGFNGAIAGTTEHSANFALSNQAVFAYGEGRITTQSTLTQSGLRLDMAAGSIDRQGWEGEAGLFRSRGMQLVSDRDIAGVSLATSLHTRLDHRKTEGSAIILYLPRRSVVSLYREGRIYSTRSYEAGNQSIDTSELPEGSYTVTARIQETGGTMREETHFFTKSPDIPPPGSPTYYVQAGIIRKPLDQDSAIPQFTGQPLVRAGTVMRVGDAGLEVGIVGLEDRIALETSTFLLYSGMQLRGTALASTRGDTGLQGSAVYTAQRFTWAADARQIWARDSPDAAMHPLLASFRQASTTASYGFTPDLTVGVRGTYNSQNAHSRSAYGPFMDWYLWREGESMLNVTADAGKAGGENTASALVRFTMRWGNYGMSGTGGYTHNATDSGATASSRAWYDNTTSERGMVASIAVEKTQRGHSVGTEGDYRNAFGRVRGVLQESENDGGRIFSYGGNFVTSMAQTQDKIAIGGDRTDTSAIIVSTQGDARTAMKIIVNGVEQGIVKPGTSQAVYLSAYQSYDIRLAPAGGGMIQYDSGARHVTLYPGNVVRLNWEVNRFYVALATLVTENGTPLMHAQLQETQGSVTDSKGRLHAQLRKTKRLSFITDDGLPCEALLPETKEKHGVLVYSNPLICKAIPLV